MAIVYPLAFPGYNYIESVRWSEDNYNSASDSPYSGQQQIYDYQVGKWLIDIDLRFLERDEAAPITAFLSKLRGKLGTFTFGDYVNSTPLGVGGGTPKVNGAGQTGFSLITDGWPNSTTNILKAGDYLQINNSLYRNLNDVNSNGSGQATLDLWPHLKSHADNSDIIITNPKGLFRLQKNLQITQYIDRNKMTQITITAEEAL